MMFDPKKPHVKAGFWTSGGDYISCLLQDGKHYDRFGRLLGKDGLPVVETEEAPPFLEPVAEIVRDEMGAGAETEVSRRNPPVKRKPPGRKPRKK